MDFFEKQRKKREIKEKFRDNNKFSKEYIKWLEEFTEKHSSFSTDSFLYKEEELSETDKKNVSIVETLYELVDDFADENYIKPIRHEFGAYYKIKHNDIGYYLGFDNGQGVSFYIARLKEPEKGSIEYKNIVSGVKLPSTVLIDNKLDELRSVIERLGNEEIPIEAIHQVADAEIQKIRIKRQKY